MADQEGLDIADMTASEIQELYNSLEQNDPGDSDNRAIDPVSAAANGIDAIRDPDG